MIAIKIWQFELNEGVKNPKNSTIAYNVHDIVTKFEKVKEESVFNTIHCESVY